MEQGKELYMVIVLYRVMNGEMEYIIMYFNWEGGKDSSVEGEKGEQK